MSNGGTPVAIVGSVLDALKTQPSTFAMIVISFGLLGYTFYEGASFNSQRGEMMKLLLDFQKETQQLLAKCTVPQHT